MNPKKGRESMRRRTAAVGSAVFFLVAPGVVVGLIPWLLTRWQARERLVVGGVYRYVRNPMYVAVLAAIVGQALLLGRLVLLLYAAAAWLVVAAFVRFYEEPTLTRRFGADYEAYRRAVPAWLPRLRPWEPGERDGPGAG